MAVPVVRIELLADHKEAIPLLRQWFETEWPSFYGSLGPGDALYDLQSFDRKDSLPIGVVALCDERVCGFAALKAESIASHRHLCPWAVAGLVEPSMRGKGIGSKLLNALEEHARRLGFHQIFCATGTAESLLLRGGWQLLERTVHEGNELGIYRKNL
ncbi:MAG: GNAT family N-acetyltransferase [Deltaproteobacteria bacterium]|nr:GNAT family N-acetyltransferase [Deltaproteobacteria bacterium]MDD3618931.1 GNAT family N-acetyltransferase [Desulfobulbaceae bacterium]